MSEEQKLTDPKTLKEVRAELREAVADLAAIKVVDAAEKERFWDQHGGWLKEYEKSPSCTARVAAEKRVASLMKSWLAAEAREPWTP